jgi:hypothetical protein
MKRLMMVLLSLISFNALAASLSLYQNPDSTSNVIGTVKEGQAIIPIFNRGDWIKVGDPTNGNVGWVTKDMLQKSSYPQIAMKITGSKNPKEVQNNLENMSKLNQNFGELWTSPDNADKK